MAYLLVKKLYSGRRVADSKSLSWTIQNIGFLALSYEQLKCPVFYGPTPAVWPKGGTLSSAGGPCLSGASWSALPRLASVRSNGARRGVNGFGAFCSTTKGAPFGTRQATSSPAGAKPGNTENSVYTIIGGTSAICSTAKTFSRAKPKIDPRYTS